MADIETNNIPIEAHPLQPFLPGGAEILMLGSFPPKRERWSMGFYYPNIQNDMWRIMGLIFFNDKEHFGMEENEPMCTHYQSPREGFCLRKCNDPINECFKLKSLAFTFGEAIRYDEGDVDIEAEEGYA